MTEAVSPDRSTPGSTNGGLTGLMRPEAIPCFGAETGRLEGVRIGRDRFFEALGEKGLLLERLPGIPRTTDSRHSLPVFHNLVKDMELALPIMDMWSRKIVGYHAGDTLDAEGALRVGMALAELQEGRFPFISITISITRTGAAGTARAGMSKNCRPTGLR